MEFAILRSELEPLKSFRRPWFVAGGWAIDLFLGIKTRDHKDVDVAVFREDQLELRRHLYNWRWEKSVNGARLPWKTDEWLELPVHEVHASRGDHHLEFLFNERGEDLWEYRRDRTVVRSISRFRAEAALPVLPPEIVLLYESHNPSQKYLADFRLVWPRLSSEARQWLAGAMVRVQPRTVDIVEVADYDAKTDFIRSFLAAQGT
jgi:aminoglycoside-2''-adenylyltransferase